MSAQSRYAELKDKPMSPRRHLKLWGAQRIERKPNDELASRARAATASYGEPDWFMPQGHLAMMLFKRGVARDSVDRICWRMQGKKLLAAGEVARAEFYLSA